MYRPRAFAVDDKDILRRFLRAHPFATLAAMVDGAVRLAHAPVIVGEDGTARFHLERGNALSRLGDGARLRLSFLGADAYVSPDWYASAGLVPTWNYSVVEGEGAVRRLDDAGLRRLLVDLSAAAEDKLAPKAPWTIDKVPAARMAALLGAIVGFAVSFETLEGKFKLSQDKAPADFAGVLRGLDGRGDARSAAVAAAMRER